MAWCPGCTVIGFRGEDNNLWLGSNSDNPWDTRTRLVVRRDENSYGIIGTELLSPDCNVPWANMLTRGLNEKGLAFVFSYVQPVGQDYSNTPGVSFREMARSVLGKCASVDEAEAMLGSMRRAFHGNFIFADRQGGLSLFEISVEKMEVSRIEKSVIRCNHYTSENMRSLCDPDYMKSVNSMDRFDAANDAFLELTADERSPKEVVEGVLKSHKAKRPAEDEWGHSPCNHGSGCGTVSSEIIDLKNEIFYYCFGWPCQDEPQNDGQLFQSSSWRGYKGYVLAQEREGVIFQHE